MSDSFDPYRVWLGVPPEARPPTHYQLLGISPDEHEKAVIEAAMLRQSGYVRNFQLGKYAKDAARILNEIAAAKGCLVDPGPSANSDVELARRVILAKLKSSGEKNAQNKWPTEKVAEASPTTPAVRRRGLPRSVGDS